MEKIESFKVNHLLLKKGLYVSRIDNQGGTYVTTFDLRMRTPNQEPVMDNAPLHTIEHLGATYLRNSNRSKEIIYFGPMGCRTGFYMVVFGKRSPEDVYQLVMDMCEYILNFEGKIPGASEKECGNWREQNLEMAKYYIEIYRNDLKKNRRFVYDDGEEKPSLIKKLFNRK